jgi:exosortase C (VPDSG-CTERM-specific)
MRGGFIVAALVLAAAGGGTLLELFRFALGSELYSYIGLIPVVSAYLVWLQKPRFPDAFRPDWFAGGMLFGGALVAWTVAKVWAGPTVEDDLSFKVLAFVLAWAGVCALGLGREELWRLRFPLGFLIFMAPIPTGVRTGVETFLQQGSAAAANGLFTLSGVPVLQDGLSFRLPGEIKFNVEPECSGIHSTVVLLITSLVAAHLLLRTRWKQALLLAVVVPLALLRNGFRIYVIGRLCVHYGDRMFDSWIHHRGGPLFFFLSMIPFFALLLWLIKTERRGDGPGPKAAATLQV